MRHGVVVDAIMGVGHAAGPCGFDVGQHLKDFPIRQDIAKADHVAFVAIADNRLGAMFGDREKLCVGVMPCVAGFVVRGCGKVAFGVAVAPVFLALKVKTVAGGALRLVDRAASRDGRLVGIGQEACRGFGPEG